MSHVDTYYEIWFPAAEGQLSRYMTTTDVDQATINASQTEGARVWLIEWSTVDVPDVGLVSVRSSTVIV